MGIAKFVEYPVPEADDQIESVYLASDFVEDILDGCSRTFALSPETEDLVIDEATGEVFLTNSNVPADFSYSIVITNSGGSDGIDDTAEAFNPSLTIEGFTISTFCGAGSTVVILPDLLSIT